MTERIPCSIPFCRRTASRAEFPHATEIICGKHWRMAPATWRRRKSKLVRRYERKFGDRHPWDIPAGSPEWIEAARLHRLADILWERCKTSIIQVCAGI